MFTCFIQYTVDPDKLGAFEQYARVWMTLINKYGGIHHGYFLPDAPLNDLLNADFNSPEIGRPGASNVAVALFSFPDKECYEAYKQVVAEDEECKKMTALFNASKCFLSYERSFLKPIFEKSSMKPSVERSYGIS